jgi:predicted metalloprotease
MRWRDLRRSENVEDRRGAPLGGAAITLGGGTLLLVPLVSVLTRTNPLDIIGGLSVRLELQADCYAGVWGHAAARRNVLEPGDVEAALAAATAIGDDRLQRQSRGVVVPESFTHGTSAQRVRWFRIGLEAGDVRRCDTFTGPRP